MQHKQEDIIFGIKISQKDSGLMKFLGNRGKFLFIYVISLSIILPGHDPGSQNIIIS